MSGAGDRAGRRVSLHCTARGAAAPIYVSTHNVTLLLPLVLGHCWTLGPLQLCSVWRVSVCRCAGPGGLRVTGLVSVRPSLQWSPLGPPLLLLLRPGRASHHTWGGHGAARRPGPATPGQLHGSRLWLDSTAGHGWHEPPAAACESPGAAPRPAPRCPRPCPRHDGARQLHIYADSRGRRVWRDKRRSGETAARQRRKTTSVSSSTEQLFTHRAQTPTALRPAETSASGQLHVFARH